MTKLKKLPILAGVLFALAALTVAGCGGGDSKTGGATTEAGGKLVVYSGREAELVEPLFKKFERDTGIEVKVRYAETPELAATIAEEGANSPADVFYAQDAGSILAIEDKLTTVEQSQLDRVPAKYRDDAGKWVGVTGRVRVLTYNTDAIKDPAELPDSVTGLTDAKWKSRLGIAPGNASFQAFVTAMRDTLGDVKTKQWLEDIKANDVKTFDGNSAIVEAVAKREIDAGLVNHYYLYQTKAETPDAPIANHNFSGGDAGSLINVSAAGILATAPNKANAERLIEFLLLRGQEFFATEAEEREYPLVDGFQDKLPSDLTPLDQIEGPDVTLDQLGAGLDDTVRMIESVGFTGT